MVKVKEDLTGQQFYDLTVLCQTEDYITPSGAHTAAWMCKCSCGKEITVTQNHLRNGHTKSCGHNQHKTNAYDLTGEYGIGWTTNTNKEFYFDLEDYDLIKQYNWYEHNPYKTYRTLLAYDNKSKTIIKFWWVVFGKNCDHIDHNTFNNQKSNLRQCNQQENMQNSGLKSNNTSGVIGVSFQKNTGKWIAYLNHNGKRVFTSKGYIKKEDAIKARLQAEQKYFGEFAPQHNLQYKIIER